MLRRCEGALLIGDRALCQEHEINGLDKNDLGAEWTAMTGMPVVWAVWAGRPGAVTPGHVQALREARDAGVAHLDEIADRFAPQNGDEGERRELARGYLHDNVSYVLDEKARAGLRKFFRSAEDLQIVPSLFPLRFFD